MKSQLPTAKIRTALWIEEFKCHLQKVDGKELNFSFDDFSRVFTQEFQRYSKEKVELPPHIRNKLVLMTGDVLNTQKKTETLEHVLHKNSLFHHESYKDFSKTSFSNWRQGESTPKALTQQIAAQLHSSSSEWFSQKQYTNRVSRLLYLVDASFAVIKNKNKQHYIQKIKSVFEEISNEWRPTTRNDWSGEELLEVRDLYIPGPDIKACDFKIDPHRKFETLRNHRIKSPNRNWATWEHFESTVKIDFDLSLDKKTFCGFSLGEDIYKKDNVIKPYSTYFMLLSLIFSDELEQSDSQIEPSLVIDLCCASICVHILSRVVPEPKYDLSQYNQGSLMSWLPKSIVQFFLEPWKISQPSNFAWSVMYDVRDSCSELRWRKSKIRKSLESNMSIAKLNLNQNGIKLGRDYHYPLLQRCLNVKNISDQALNQLVYKEFSKLLTPLISTVFDNTAKVDYLKRDNKDYPFENYRCPNGLVNAAGP